MMKTKKMYFKFGLICTKKEPAFMFFPAISYCHLAPSMWFSIDSLKICWLIFQIGFYIETEDDYED